MSLHYRTVATLAGSCHHRFFVLSQIRGESVSTTPPRSIYYVSSPTKWPTSGDENQYTSTSGTRPVARHWPATDTFHHVLRRVQQAVSGARVSLSEKKITIHFRRDGRAQPLPSKLKCIVKRKSGRRALWAGHLQKSPILLAIFPLSIIPPIIIN
jgi:hypothetical protein